MISFVACGDGPQRRTANKAIQRPACGGPLIYSVRLAGPRMETERYPRLSVSRKTGGERTLTLRLHLEHDRLPGVGLGNSDGGDLLAVDDPFHQSVTVFSWAESTSGAGLTPNLEKILSVPRSSRGLHLMRATLTS
jgi:hypothetical protein